MLNTRFAPTPSGYLHVGNAMSFIVTWLVARANEGKILLRIDDLDAERMRTEYVEDIFQTLDWLGLDYDEGPSGVEDFLKNYSQHTRLDLYAEALKNLQNTEGVLYACDCSRKKIKEHASNGLYPNICRNKSLHFEDKENAWRIIVPAETAISYKEFDPKTYKTTVESNLLAQTVGDFVVRKKNGLPAYQIASLVDDGHFNINFIVRGEDLLNSTAAQVFLAKRLGYEKFCQNVFFHHPLITNTEGVKLSKSAGAESLKMRREKGISPLQLYKNVANWLGFDEEINDLQDLKTLYAQSIQATSIFTSFQS